MNRSTIALLFLILLMAAGCSNEKRVAAATTVAPKSVAVSTAQAAARTVAAGFDATGSFEADETSDIAPMVAGRVIATPANVGDFVKQGQVICELDHRDAQLRLDQGKAQLEQATAGLRQAQSRIGWNGSGKFDPSSLPEVAAARANYESAQAMARLAAADARRYENLVATGDVSRSAYDKARTQQEDGRGPGQCRPATI